MCFAPSSAIRGKIRWLWPVCSIVKAGTCRWLKSRRSSKGTASVKKNVLAALAALREERYRLDAEIREETFALSGVAIPLETRDDPCPKCGGPMMVQKSHRHGVVTLEHGSFVASETVLVCAARCTDSSGALVTRRPEILARSVAPGCVYGYDVEVQVGIQRFVHHRQREEIRQDLKDLYGISLSTGEVSTLEARFIQHFECLHRRRAPAIRDALARDGGYPLHIDATGEDGRGTLFIAYAGWRGWVLGSWKISTERADLILPHLCDVSASFGAPCALLRDLGRAVIDAALEFVKGLRRGIPIIGCHQHFLSDVGNDLMEPSHDELRNLFRRSKIRPRLRTFARDLARLIGPKISALRVNLSTWLEEATDYRLPEGQAGLATVRALAQWALDYASEGDDLGFPYDRPYLDLYKRCRTVSRATDAFRRRPIKDRTVRRYLKRLAKILDPVITDTSFSRIAKTLSTRVNLFEELRVVLRLNPKPPGEQEPNQNRAAAELRDIQKAIKSLARSLRRRRPQRGPAQDSREAIDLVLDHLDRHGDSLWGHVIHLPARVGGGTRVVARTNNLVEGLFHQMKHGERRRSGRKVLTRDFEVLPAGAALACNLSHPDYVKLLCGSLEKLPAAFAALGQSLPRDRTTSTEPETLSASFTQADRRIVRAERLRRIIEEAARSRAPRFYSATA